MRTGKSFEEFRIKKSQLLIVVFLAIILFITGLSFTVLNSSDKVQSSDKENETVHFECIGTTDDIGFMSLFEYDDKLYAGTYNPGYTSIYTYDKSGLWGKIASLNAGESVFAFAEFEGNLYAATESRGQLYKSTNGKDFNVIFTSENNLGLGITVFKNDLYVTFTSFVYKGTGPLLYKSSDGNSFSEISWPPTDGQNQVYESQILNNKMFTCVYNADYSKTNVYSSSDGSNWNLMKEYKGIINFLTVYKNKIYGVRNGKSIHSFDGKNDKILYTADIQNSFQALAFYNDAMYLLTTAGWKKTSGEKAALYRFNLESKELTKLGSFNELEGMALKVYDNCLFVGTKDHSKNSGSVYKVTITNE